MVAKQLEECYLLMIFLGISDSKERLQKLLDVV